MSSSVAQSPHPAPPAHRLSGRAFDAFMRQVEGDLVRSMRRDDVTAAEVAERLTDDAIRDAIRDRHERNLALLVWATTGYLPEKGSRRSRRVGGNEAVMRRMIERVRAALRGGRRGRG